MKRNSKLVRKRTSTYNPGFNQNYNPDDIFQDLWKRYN